MEGMGSVGVDHKVTVFGGRIALRSKLRESRFHAIYRCQWNTGIGRTIQTSDGCFEVGRKVQRMLRYHSRFLTF